MSEYKDQVKVFRALGHPVRLQILDILAHGPARVCDLVLQTGRRQANISQHLAVLRQAGLVDSEKDGILTRYHLVESKLDIIIQVLMATKNLGPNRG